VVRPPDTDKYKHDRHHHHHHGKLCDRKDYCDRFNYSDEYRFAYQSSDRNYQYGADAAEQGYRDGVYTGANDARRGQSYDPQRSHFFGRGAGGFMVGLFASGRYQQEYRDAFLRGYAEGFQNYQSYFFGGQFQFHR